MHRSLQISRLKSALESKESEVVQLKDHNRRMAMEMKNLRTASPLQLPKYGTSLYSHPEDDQQPANDPRQNEVCCKVHQCPCLGDMNCKWVLVAKHNDTLKHFFMDK